MHTGGVGSQDLLLSKILAKNQKMHVLYAEPDELKPKAGQRSEDFKQVIDLMRSPEQRAGDQPPPNILLGIREAKGLEFSDTIIVNFFARLHRPEGCLSSEVSGLEVQ
jgi:hypothetical protein